MVAGLYEAAAKIARQAREVGITAPLLAGDGVFSDKYITLAELASENTYISTPFLFQGDNPAEEAFKKAYQQKYSKDPKACASNPAACENPDAWAALAYDAVNLIADSIRKKGWDRQKIRDYVASLDTPEEAFPGITGATYFDKEGDCKKPVMMAVVRDGTMQPAPKLP